VNKAEEIRSLEPDPYHWVYEASEQHRQTHGAECHVYPTSSGPLLGWLARATGAGRVLEVGCGLGYSALWLARGCAPDGRVETIESVQEHANLAKEAFGREGVAESITVLLGRGRDLLPDLTGMYDLVFLDSDWWEYPDYFSHLLRLVPPGGVIVSSNIFPHEFMDDPPGQNEIAEYRRQLFSHPGLVSTILREAGKALSLRV